MGLGSWPTSLPDLEGVQQLAVMLACISGMNWDVKAEDKLLHVGVHHMDRCRWAHLHLEAHVQRLARTESRREGDELFKPAGLQLPNLQSGDNTDSPYGIATRMK